MAQDQNNNQNNQPATQAQAPAASQPKAGSMVAQAKQGAGQTVTTNPMQLKVNSIRSMIEKSASQLVMVLQTDEKVKRFTREFMTMVQGNTQLVGCTEKSLVAAAIQSAQLNLSLDKNMGQAYVVPYKGVAQFQIGYLGYLTLARRSGEIKSIRAEIVYEGDEWKRQYTQDGVKFTHIPCPPSQRGDRIGVYMVAQFTNGGSHFEFMYAEEVEEIKKLSPGARKTDSIWELHTEAMWKKTVIKRSAKYLPLSVEAQRASRIDELQDAGVYIDPEEFIDTELEAS